MLYRSQYCKFVVCFLAYAYASVFAGEGSNRVMMLPSNKELHDDDIRWLQNNLNKYLDKKGYFEHRDFKGIISCFARRNKPDCRDRYLLNEESERLRKKTIPFLTLNTGYTVLQHVLGDCDWYIKNRQYSKAYEKMQWIASVLRYHDMKNKWQVDTHNKFYLDDVLLHIAADPCKCVMFCSLIEWPRLVSMFNQNINIEGQQTTFRHYLAKRDYALADVMLRDQGHGVVFRQDFRQLWQTMRDGQSLDIVRARIVSWKRDKQHQMDLHDKYFQEDYTACMSEEDAASVLEEVEYRQIERFLK